jgi:hypothetical protein
MKVKNLTFKKVRNKFYEKERIFSEIFLYKKLQKFLLEKNFYKVCRKEVFLYNLSESKQNAKKIILPREIFCVLLTAYKPTQNKKRNNRKDEMRLKEFKI